MSRPYFLTYCQNESLTLLGEAYTEVAKALGKRQQDYCLDYSYFEDPLEKRDVVDS